MAPAPAGDHESGLRIFINYRRDDTKWPAGRLNDRLASQFEVFMDIDTLKPGENFAEKIQDALDDSDIVFVLIGQNWLSVTDEDGRRRLDDPADHVTREIAAALMRDDVIVIPTLVDGARMPKIADLPESLGGLPDRHASELSTQRWGYDVRKMIERLSELEAEKKTRTAEPRPAEDMKGEEETKHPAAGRAGKRRAEPRQVKPGAKKATRREQRTPGRLTERPQLGDGRAAPKILLSLRGHQNVVESVAYSPDGSRIVTASRDRTARIWDAASGAMLQVLSYHEHGFGSAAYSPDGSRIVTACFDGTARIWDAANGAERQVLFAAVPWRTRLRPRDALRSAAYSPDGNRIVTGSDDRKARIWDASSGAELLVLSGHEGSVDSAAYSPDGSRILTASAQTARIWDPASGVELQVLSGHSCLSAAYSPDGSRIVTACYDGTARIWDAVSGAELLVLSGHGSSVDSAAYSPDGRRIVTSSTEARIWDAASGVVLHVLAGHESRGRSTAYSPDGKRIAIASDEGTVCIWSTVGS